MPGRPAHFNFLRLIGRLEAIHKAHQRITGFLVHVDTDGDPCKVAVWPRPPVPTDLRVGDLVEVTGCLKYDNTEGRKALHYIDGKVELVRRTSPIGAGGNGVGGAGSHTSDRRTV
jgi:hypothetical protein